MNQNKLCIYFIFIAYRFYCSINERMLNGARNKNLLFEIEAMGNVGNTLFRFIPNMVSMQWNMARRIIQSRIQLSSIIAQIDLESICSTNLSCSILNRFNTTYTNLPTSKSTLPFLSAHPGAAFCLYAQTVWSRWINSKQCHEIHQCR